MTAKPFRRRGRKTWLIRLTDHTGSRFELSVYPDKKLTERFAERLERLVMYRAAGEPLDRELATWLEGLPSRILETLEARDLLDPRTKLRLQPLEELITAFERYLTQKGNTEQHVGVTIRRARDPVSP